MRTLYRFFLLLAVGLLTALSGCGEDETPSLATYPDNNFFSCGGRRRRLGNNSECHL